MKKRDSGYPSTLVGASVFNGCLIAVLVFVDVYAQYVLGFVASSLLCEVLRFFGITSLIIVTIHTLVAGRYPRDTMLLSAMRIQAVYYCLLALAIWFSMPNHLFMVRLHAAAMIVVALLVLFRPLK